jgi:hypothetical protein
VVKFCLFWLKNFDYAYVSPGKNLHDLVKILGNVGQTMTPPPPPPRPPPPNVDGFATSLLIVSLPWSCLCCQRDSCYPCFLHYLRRRYVSVVFVVTVVLRVIPLVFVDLTTVYDLQKHVIPIYNLVHLFLFVFLFASFSSSSPSFPWPFVVVVLLLFFVFQLSFSFFT